MKTHRGAPTTLFLLFPLLASGCADAPGPEMTPAEIPPETTPGAEVAPGELPPEQEAFWARLLEHCGNAYPGHVADATPYYTSATEYETVVAHFRECSQDRIHIPMHMDDDRSRNWILTRVGGTIRLKHDHRHEDGTEEEITQYGGDAPVPGLPHRQIFPADEHTASILPDRWDNFWFMDFMDEETFAYGVHWPEHGHSIRIHFDLAAPVDTPPDPWGY
jgi:hypothetical protein